MFGEVVKVQAHLEKERYLALVIVDNTRRANGVLGFYCMNEVLKRTLVEELVVKNFTKHEQSAIRSTCGDTARWGWFYIFKQK